MIHFQRSLIIDATPDAVWHELRRFMNIDEFAPQVTSVDALTEGEITVGSKRRCHFQDGNSMAEEVVQWQENEGYRVKLFETEPMPIKEAFAEISLAPAAPGKTNVVWSMDCILKYGPIGWLIGQTLMKGMMGKVLDANLNGLATKVLAGRKTAA